MDVSKTRIEEIAIKIDTHAQVAADNLIAVGELLCEARELFPADQEFGKWRKERLPWLNRKSAYRMMNAYRNGGENLVGHNVAPTSIFLLTAPSVPEEARAEAAELAEQGETITAKQAKEIADLHKKIEAERAKIAQLSPDMDNLVPGLMLLHKSGSLPEATALEFSKLDQGIQQHVVLPKLKAEKKLQDELARLEVERTRALERESKAREEAELARNDLAEMEGETIRQMLAKKNSEILAKEKELQLLEKQMERGIRDKVEEKIRNEIEAEKQAEIEKARKAMEKAQRERADSLKNAKYRYDCIVSLEKKNEELERQLEIGTPAKVDESRAREVMQTRDLVEVSLRAIERDALEHGAVMDKSMAVVVDIARIAAAFVEKQAGDAVIDI